MRIVVTGASGNVGSSLVGRLSRDDRVTSIVALARRPSPDTADEDKTVFAEADVGIDDLRPLFDGADVVVHLAWLFQPTHRPLVTWRANAVGSQRVFEAAAAAGVGALVYASSVGAYSPLPERRRTRRAADATDADERVPESWPTHGLPTAAYGREKAYVERLLDAFEARHPDVRVARMRPGFIFKRPAATEQRRLFVGPLLPNFLVEAGRLPVLPLPAGLRFQALHADDAAEAYRLAVVGDVRGAFNLAADPVIDGERLAELLDTRLVRAPRLLARAALATAWHAHVAPADPALLDLVLGLPLLDTTRAHQELGWTPERSAVDAVRELLEGMASGAGADTPPLAPDTPSRRIHEAATGIGERP